VSYADLTCFPADLMIMMVLHMCCISIFAPVTFRLQRPHCLIVFHMIIQLVLESHKP
jgi:hypothetical protein